MTESKVGIVGAVGAIVFAFITLQAHTAAALDSEDPSGAVVSFSSDGLEDATSDIIYLAEGSNTLVIAYTKADGTDGDPTTLSFASDDPSVQTDATVGADGSLSVQVNPGAFANLSWSAVDGSTGSVQIVDIGNQDPSSILD